MFRIIFSIVRYNLRVNTIARGLELNEVARALHERAGKVERK